MSEVLYSIVRIVAKIHNYIMHLNDAFELYFSDKEMHFIIIGLLGMGMLFIIYPLFKWLAENKHVMVISWIYVFTLVIVIAFAIEIGQKVSNTGNMEFDDIMFGAIGFIAMFAVFSVVRSIYHFIMMYIKSKLGADKKDEVENKEETAEEVEAETKMTSEPETDNVYQDVKKEKVTINKPDTVPKVSEIIPKEQKLNIIELDNAADIDTELIAQAYEEQISEAQTEGEHTKEI